MKNIFLIFISFCFISSLSAQDWQKAVDDMNNKMIKYMMEDNTEALMAMFVDDNISLPSYQPMIVGKEAMREADKKNKQMEMKFNDFQLTTTHLMDAGDYVIDIGTYSLNMTMAGMPEPVTDKGKYITIFEKQDDGSLKIAVDTWNTDMNPWEMMGNEKEGHDENDDDNQVDEKEHKNHN